jgi:hypothetical protein
MSAPIEPGMRMLNTSTIDVFVRFGDGETVKIEPYVVDPMDRQPAHIMPIEAFERIKAQQEQK